MGGAVGDALGAPVEFMRRSEILSTFGPNGITEYAPAYGGLGTITDDTQMTLFTAEGLLRAHVRFCFRGMCHPPSVVSSAYLRWLLTQGERPAKQDHEMGDGWLFQQRALHNRRAPGNTCLSALKAMKSFGDPACNDSKGCGGVMRMAPAGLMTWRKQEGWRSATEAFLLGTELAAYTHGHPTGALTGGVLAVLVLALVDGTSLQNALAVAKALLQKVTTDNSLSARYDEGTKAVCRKKDAHKETLHAIEMAEALAASSMPQHEAIAKLGQGWVAEEALAISIYCALVACNFREGVILAVNHDGDSDSTGSITGNLLGAIYGVKSIPVAWLEPLELRGVITEIAEDLYAWRDWEIGLYREHTELSERIWQKYPGC